MLYSFIWNSRREEEGLTPTLASLAGELTGEEMSHLAQVTAQPEDTSQAEQSLRDYISLIREERLRREGGQKDELLLAVQKKLQEKKAYMEEKP